MDWEVGQQVAVYRWYELRRMDVVERLTGTLVITKECGRFRRNNGYAPGENFDHIRIEPLTDAHKDELRRREIHIELGRTQWSKLPTATLEAVLEIVKEATNATK